MKKIIWLGVIVTLGIGSFDIFEKDQVIFKLSEELVEILKMKKLTQGHVLKTY